MIELLKQRGVYAVDCAEERDTWQFNWYSGVLIKTCVGNYAMKRRSACEVCACHNSKRSGGGYGGGKLD